MYHHFRVYDNVSRLFSTDFFSKMTNFKEKNREIKVLIRARSQIPVYGLTGRGLGGRAPGAEFCRQNLGIKYIPCIDTHL